jgi:hypothetical protein
MVNGKTEPYPSHRCVECTLVRCYGPGQTCAECLQHIEDTALYGTAKPSTEPFPWQNNLEPRSASDIYSDLYRTVYGGKP